MNYQKARSFAFWKIKQFNYEVGLAVDIAALKFNLKNYQRLRLREEIGLRKLS